MPLAAVHAPPTSAVPRDELLSARLKLSDASVVGPLAAGCDAIATLMKSAGDNAPPPTREAESRKQRAKSGLLISRSKCWCKGQRACGGRWRRCGSVVAWRW